MKLLRNPRFVEPIAAALMGAGFFVFVSALLGGPFWQSMEDFLWSRLKGQPSSAPAEALWVQGEVGLSELSVAQRRLALAHSIDQFSAAGARLIVLEAWLDEPSQIESEEALADLLDASQGLSKRTQQSLRSKVQDIKTKLNADETLAASMAKAGNLILPVAVESDPQALSSSGAVWAKLGSYQVSRKGKGLQELDKSWHVVRAPIEEFRDACLGLALLAGGSSASPEEPLRVPSIFELHGQWANGIGFEAAREALGVPSKGLHFIWRQGVLRAVELRGVEYPLSSAGELWLPRLSERERWVPLRINDVDAPGALSNLKNKIVFYQPWPELLVQSDQFQDQRDLCAGMLSERMAQGPEAHAAYWALLAFWLLLLALCASLAPPLAFLALALALGGILWRFFAFQELLALPLGLWLSALACGLGLQMILRKMKSDERRLWLRGHVAPKARRLWQSLVPDPTQGTMLEGVYLAIWSKESLRLANWEAWAERWKVFCEALDDHRAGFFFSPDAQQSYPLEAIRELRMGLGAAKLASSKGALALAAERVLDSVRWSLNGKAKDEALQLLDYSKENQYFITESDYSFIRQNVKIQVIGDKELLAGAGLKRIFNVLEIALEMK